ncbi:MAG: nuclear transport factor 2 family protein [Chloroflexia bacterium]|nr:nuclear transport factor 2 family protein [Chloroflexia bacterium]
MSRMLFVVAIVVLTLLLPATVAAQDATPATGLGEPDPAECTVEPRPMSFFEEFVGTPTAEQAARTEATPDAGFRMPDGTPADEDTVAAVLGTVRQLGACINAGDFLGGYGALFTEDFIRDDLESSGPLAAEELSLTPEPMPAEMRVSLLAVVDVRVLPDGRVAGLFDIQDPFAEPPGPSRFYWEFVKEDGRWLIDEQIMLGPMEPEQVGTPTS